jgi:alkyl hydroperoxide reductase subunit AhpF
MTLTDTTRALVRDGLADLAGPVTLRYYTSDVDSWYSRVERALLEEIASTSAHVALEVHADRWDAKREEEVGIRRTPAIVVAGERDTGIRYYGLPDGYELETFLGVLRTAAGGPSLLSPTSIARLGALPRPVHLEVVVSPT